MAYEQEAMMVATEAFIRDVCDQLELSDDQSYKATDEADTIACDLALCNDQSEVNEQLVSAFAEIFNHDQEANNVMAGTIDFFWQIYNDTKESEIDEA